MKDVPESRESSTMAEVNRIGEKVGREMVTGAGKVRAKEMAPGRSEEVSGSESSPEGKTRMSPAAAADDKRRQLNKSPRHIMFREWGGGGGGDRARDNLWKELSFLGGRCSSISLGIGQRVRTEASGGRSKLL